ncbi:MAG: hypothetical protein LKJ11_07525 [Lactobacillus sp.]|jgi:hypothetical protein|nr:hypothetical protein [Lactobacillus sp.]
MTVLQSEQYRRLVFFHKYAALLYLLLYGLSMGLFFKLRLYELEYYPLDSYLTKHKIREYGLVRLRGNLGSIQDWWVLLLLLIGIGVGLALFFDTGRKLKQPRAAALLVTLGALIPLLPPYNENVLTRIAVGTGLLFFGALGQWFFNLAVFARRSRYQKEHSYFDSVK